MLPRLDLASATDVDVGQCEALLINQPTAVQAEGYAAAGLQTDALRVVKNRHFLCCRHLYVTSIPHDVPAWSVRYLRRTFALILPASGNGPKAIYLRRGHSPNRRVQNEDEVCAYLSARGVTAFDFSEYSFREQVQTVANADVIIAPHGAALANLAFARRGARVLEIFATAENQKCYWMLACHCRAIYHYVVGQPIPRGDNSNKFDMVMPLEKLDRALDFLLRDSDAPTC
jgi:capsular polysaccharide biosynthesis protein